MSPVTFIYYLSLASALVPSVGLAGTAWCLSDGPALMERNVSTPPLDAHTGVYGVGRESMSEIVTLIHRHLGDAVLGIYVIGSRASGRTKYAKGGGPVALDADLDLVIHVTDANHSVKMKALRQALADERILPFSIELHPTSSDENKPFVGALTAYPAGDEATYQNVDPRRETAAERRPFSPAVRVSP